MGLLVGDGLVEGVELLLNSTGVVVAALFPVQLQGFAPYRAGLLGLSASTEHATDTQQTRSTSGCRPSPPSRHHTATPWLQGLLDSPPRTCNAHEFLGRGVRRAQAGA